MENIVFKYVWVDASLADGTYLDRIVNKEMIQFVETYLNKYMCSIPKQYNFFAQSYSLFSLLLIMVFKR